MENKNVNAIESKNVEPGFIAQYMGVTPMMYCIYWVLTLGIYSFFFQHKLTKLMVSLNMDGELEKLTKWTMLNWQLRIGSFVLGFILTFIGAASLLPLARILIVVAIVFEVMWSFKARSVLSFYVADKYKVLVEANGFMMFFFPCLSLTMMFSSVEKEVELLKVLRSKQ